MQPILSHLSILGFKVQDRVTKLEGVATSVSFDLYGCVQVIVNPGLDNDGKPRDCVWFDIARLVPLSKKPVMEVPDYITGAIAVVEGKKGPAEKPANARF